MLSVALHAPLTLPLSAQLLSTLRKVDNLLFSNVLGWMPGATGHVDRHCHMVGGTRPTLSQILNDRSIISLYLGVSYVDLEDTLPAYI